MRYPALGLSFFTAAVIAFAAEPAAPPPAEPPRALSPDTTAKVTAGLPKFAPAKRLPEGPPPASPFYAATPAEPESSSDLPPDNIIRLPNYAVRDKPLPEFRERELLTPAGRIDLALRRYPGLKFGPLAFLNRDIARRMLEEDNQLERQRESVDHGAFIQFANTLRPPAAADSPPAGE